MKIPKGFQFAALNCGIKAARKDLALVYSEQSATAAGVFTINKAAAAPIVDARSRIPGTGFRALVVNSGNANALTGARGLEDVLAVREAVGKALGVSAASVAMASTGVIGIPLAVPKIVAAAPELAKGRGPNPVVAAEAMMTTDTRVKLASRTMQVGGVAVTLSAIAKGAGMIAPEMATMICFITTDASVDAKTLQAMLQRATEASFSNLTVDNDMSTNDCVIALANGAAGAPALRDKNELASFEDKLTSLCIEIAKAIAEDGEGATKMLEVNVRGLADLAIARDLAKTVAGSSLVKAALFGADPNWGRILSAVGARAGSKRYAVEPTQTRVQVQGQLVYDQGNPTPQDLAQLRARMREPSVVVDVDFGAGDAVGTAWGCDLSYDYVKINADYTSLTSASPDGTVTKDDRLTNYGPSFKRALLVEALSYISKFKGRRAVIQYGGAAMVKDALKASFASDVNLLRSAGLFPVVVHGGAPDGSAPEDFEMILSGRVNTELVTLLNQGVAHAVGVSGKDAGLLRAKKPEPGQHMAKISSVQHELLEVLVGKEYVPVLSPVGLGEDGEGYLLDADDVAADVAVALKAEKLIFLTDVPGLLHQGELISEITAEEIQARRGELGIEGGMAIKVDAALRALAGGVSQVHIIDGRAAHGLVAELFTDRGIGTLVRAS